VKVRRRRPRRSRTSRSPFLTNFSVTAASRPKFSSSVDVASGVVTLFLPDAEGPGGGENLLVCPKLWNMAAANVACKNKENLL